MGLMEKILDVRSVQVGTQGTDKNQVLRQLVDQISNLGCVTDSEQLYQDVLDRENLSPTTLGDGCAVPHAHSAGITETRIAALCLAKPMDFGASDGIPVSLVFLMAGPPQNTGLHLKLLSKLVRLLHDRTLREALTSAQNPQEFVQILTQRD
jgi:fructose-specific phosphotransferase system IIA component